MKHAIERKDEVSLSETASVLYVAEPRQKEKEKNCANAAPVFLYITRPSFGGRATSPSFLPRGWRIPQVAARGRPFIYVDTIFIRTDRCVALHSFIRVGVYPLSLTADSHVLF